MSDFMILGQVIRVFLLLPSCLTGFMARFKLLNPRQTQFVIERFPFGAAAPNEAVQDPSENVSLENEVIEQ
jgi:hypothetical protein